MNLKRRLIISHAAVVIIPLLITIAASFAFILVSSQIFSTTMGYNDLAKFFTIRYELSRIKGELLQGKPEMLMDKEFQQRLTERLDRINADIVVLKNNDVVFSTINLSKIDLEKCLDAGDEGMLSNSVELGTTSYIVNTFTIAFKDGEWGETILLTHAGKEENILSKLLIFMSSVFLISFLATNAVLSLGFSKSILKPLARLKAAAGEISRGNLGYEVVEDGNEEIKELCRSFEQMRLKLSDSVHTQMKYDDNRRMLVSSISHDLKTPVTSIKGYVEGILDGVANTPEKAEKYLKTVYSKAVQLDAMIDDLLLYSKLDLNQLPFNFEKTDLVKYFEDCIAESEHELEKANIEISLENELKGPVDVMMDRDRIRRVVINIFDNARKYMDKVRGKITVVLREIPSSIIIEFRDNGSGIAKEDLPYIFDRFYRADAARSRMGGSGLGLAIAKQIVEGHGGKIWGRSPEDEGTSIMISLNRVKRQGDFNHEENTHS